MLRPRVVCHFYASHHRKCVRVLWHFGLGEHMAWQAQRGPHEAGVGGLQSAQRLVLVSGNGRASSLLAAWLPPPALLCLTPPYFLSSSLFPFFPLYFLSFTQQIPQESPKLGERHPPSQALPCGGGEAHVSFPCQDMLSLDYDPHARLRGTATLKAVHKR